MITHNKSYKIFEGRNKFSQAQNEILPKYQKLSHTQTPVQATNNYTIAQLYKVYVLKSNDDIKTQQTFIGFKNNCMLFDLKRTLNKIELNNNNNNKKSKRQAAGPHQTSITYALTHIQNKPIHRRVKL